MWNKVRFAAQVIMARSFGRRVPLCVTMHVTPRCNFNCVYCYGGYAEKNKKEFTLGEIFSLVDELKKRGTRWITLSGGEPLIRKDIDAIVDRIKKKKIICSINTNGSLIREKIKTVKKVDFITVSLDGDEAGNDMNRGRGTYKRIMDGIECLRGNKIAFDAVSVLTKSNMHSVDALLDLAEKKGFPVEFNFPQDQNIDQQDQSPFRIEDIEMRSILTKLMEAKKRGRPVHYSAGARRYALSWPVSYKRKVIYEDIPGFKAAQCYMGRLMCHIDSDGRVYPCTVLAGKFPALNFLEEGFGKSWDNLRDKKKCKACYAVCYAEFNRFFALAPGTWFNNIKETVKTVRIKKNLC